ncbi:MAG: hypothetical protein O2782_07330 [bacterium]|nr:hypothetical protein [bacterium]
MERYPELPPELDKGGPAALLKYFGPRAIIASVTIGRGETVFASRGGTILGVYELSGRRTHECLRPVSARIRHMPLAQLRPWVVGCCGIAGIAIMWFGGNYP